MLFLAKMGDMDLVYRRVAKRSTRTTKPETDKIAHFVNTVSKKTPDFEF